MMIFTPFVEVSVITPVPAVIANFCVILVNASFRIVAKSVAEGGVITVSSSSLQLDNKIVAKNNNPMFLKFVFMVSSF